ncbi:MAG TPA: SgcJ/EcaC family oxidoreductase [Acidimicrobiales bacterium]|jgi:limonene-1,2-epoxide hydrolase|nr:SgcJ/EcaC family oxidoreductase [Acidimicrobiales bacterium]
MTTDQRTLIDRFFDAWRSMDAGAVAEFFTDDAVYHNIPMDRIVGRDAIKATVAGWLSAMKSIDFRFNHVVVDGNVVLMERCDIIPTSAGEAELPIMATFELDGDRIRAWREYFDLGQMRALIAGQSQPS